MPDPAYVDYVSERIALLIGGMQRGKRHRASCTYHEGELNHSMNRRLACVRLGRFGVSRSIGLGPNPHGERDEKARILRFADSDGDPIVVVWNYTCHASDFFDPLRVSAAYPGRVRRRLRAELGNIPVLFLQGFAGDVRPPFYGISADVKGLIKRAMFGPQFRAPTKREWDGWSDSLAASITAINRSSPAEVEIGEPMTERIGVPQADFVTGGGGSKALFWHVVDCAGFQVVGINAEPVVRYRSLIQAAFDSRPLLTVGCLDQTHCYLPTDDMIEQGGYEVEGFRRLFAFEGRFRGRMQDSIIDRLKQRGSRHHHSENSGGLA
jgi:hypothetical protein